jgi:Icc protein
VIVQLSDPHIGASWGGITSESRLAGAIASVRGLRDRPDVVLVSGDLAHNATDAEYERVREMVGWLGLPVHVLPGNRDDRAAMRRHFELPGRGPDPIQYSVEIGPMRLVVVDTTVPGERWGELDAARLAWLEQELAYQPEYVTLLAMHHPPIASTSPTWDELAGLRPNDRRALADVLRGHPQVRRIVAGHAHRTMTAELMGRTVLAAPAIFVQTHLAYAAPDAEFVEEPGGYALHALIEGEFTSEVHSFG